MRHLFFILLALGIASISHAQTQDADMDAIAVKISNTDHVGLEKVFGDMVEISLPGNEGSYSKNQAKFILKDFFLKYPIKSFTIKHRGNSTNGSKYAIGEYEYEKGKLRAYFLLKKKEGKYRIHILQFAKQ
jgi:Domain of unknown function (DUF4783)